MEFLDRLLTCSDCGSEFVFTAGEQLFFFEKQFKNDPKRCKPCKSRRTGTGVLLRTGSTVPPMRAPRPETRTECSACGIETTVPFKPTQGRPVLCRQCFQVHQAPPLVASTKNRERTHAHARMTHAKARMNTATAELVAAASNAEHSAVSVELAPRPTRA